MEDQDQDPNSLEANVKYLLDQCPHTVRDLSGDFNGTRFVEFLPGSLAITFLGMQGRIKELEEKCK